MRSSLELYHYVFTTRILFDFHKSWIRRLLKTKLWTHLSKVSKKAKSLLSEIQRKTGSNMDKLWLDTEKKILNRIGTNRSKNTGTNIQLVLCDRIEFSINGCLNSIFPRTLKNVACRLYDVFSLFFYVYTITIHQFNVFITKFVKLII
ncbi:hypothetical protein RCL_jg24662.t1 [Rhizophagus clarus]|uniref:Uncharacterized protein n=1 Tax=Rhizophagus clarus TaxID=94130 RepID=A0A8H3M864_9GLOM|nr:hypothetical protein RCL_jg24662.t1 [Rhizophagus clarus]